MDTKEKQQPYKPSATTLTVHSQRNLKALEQQLKQQNDHVKTKEPLRFSHRLLLGHVSVLTDILSVQVPHGDNHRNYIITADRDEHIRVSRGMPQAHVIEGFCLGHKSFVSKLCVAKNMLISGDGDGCLHVWDWVGAKLLNKIDIAQLLPDKHGGDAGTHGKAAISGLWTWSSSIGTELLLIACEGHDTLWHINGEDLLRPDAHRQCRGYEVGGNILDLAVCGEQIIVSRDTYHVARTMDEAREKTNEPSAEVSRLCSLEYSDQSKTFSLTASGASHEALERIESAIGIETDGMSTGVSLYGLHSLRKRGGEEVSEDPT